MVDAKLKLQIAGELRDSIDMFTHTPAEYTRFLQKLMPVFNTILSGQPVFISTSPEQVRNCYCVLPLCLCKFYLANLDDRNYGISHSIPFIDYLLCQ